MSDKISPEFLQKLEKDFLEQFILFDSNINEEDQEEFKKAFINILENLLFNDKQIDEASINLARLHIKNEINYILLSNHLNELKNCTIEAITHNHIEGNILELLLRYSTIEMLASHEYLLNYINKVCSANNIRLASLNDMIQKDMIRYYEEHLLWLDTLVKSVKNSNFQLVPELNPTMCNFGKWLISQNAKDIIRNNSKYKNILKTHDQLHDIGILISKQLQKEKPNYHVLMNYLEKCELISLSIGTELALIDNTLIIKKASKDELTGALNRNSLEQMFINQYELSLATDSNFLLAMCDLDHFKFINDTYGHVAGDKLLKAFVKITHETLRKSDIVIRYGGEEFLIMMPNTSLETGVQKLDQLREIFQDFCIKYDEEMVKTTVSIGLISIEPQIMLQDNKITMNDYIHLADDLLYKAKQNGRNRIIVR